MMIVFIVLFGAAVVMLAKLLSSPPGRQVFLWLAAPELMIFIRLWPVIWRLGVAWVVLVVLAACNVVQPIGVVAVAVPAYGGPGPVLDVEPIPLPSEVQARRAARASAWAAPVVTVRVLPQPYVSHARRGW